MKLFISIQPVAKAGGSNTFASNLTNWAKNKNYQLVSSILDAEIGVVIAHRGVTTDLLRQAKKRNCFILHRIDEHLGALDSPRYKEKHQLIKELNAYSDITVYQSEFVKRTAQPFLKTKHHVVIHNGADPAIFHPSNRPGKDIGHVTWGTDEKKRLDLLYREILARPDDRFRLVGRQRHVHDQAITFRLKNVSLRGEKKRKSIPAEYRKMKVLFFPSENDPCPNTVIEAILSGVPVCYHDSGGTPELVRNCGVPLDRFEYLLDNIEKYRDRCLTRTDLHFDVVMEKYEQCWSSGMKQQHIK